jgi:hypothetical protein
MVGFGKVTDVSRVVVGLIALVVLGLLSWGVATSGLKAGAEDPGVAVSASAGASVRLPSAPSFRATRWSGLPHEKVKPRSRSVPTTTALTSTTADAGPQASDNTNPNPSKTDTATDKTDTSSKKSKAAGAGGSVYGPERIVGVH